MVAFNRNFGFPQQPQIGRGLVNLRNNSLRPGNSPLMPRTEVGKLTGESPKTDGVKDETNTIDTMGRKFFYNYEDYEEALKNGDLKAGDEVLVRLDNGKYWLAEIQEYKGQLKAEPLAYGTYRDVTTEIRNRG